MKKYPALMGSLGTAQPKAKALAFRVWLHPHHGSDVFLEEKSYGMISVARKKLLNDSRYAKVESIIGVFEKKVAKYPDIKYWEAKLK